MKYYEIYCSNCNIRYKIDKDIDKCILCNSSNITKTEHHD